MKDEFTTWHGTSFSVAPWRRCGPSREIHKQNSCREDRATRKKERKQQVQKTSLRAGRLTLHTQRNQNEAKEPGSLLQGSVKRIELNALHMPGSKMLRALPRRYLRARAQGATFVGAPAGTLKICLSPYAFQPYSQTCCGARLPFNSFWLEVRLESCLWQLGG